MENLLKKEELFKKISIVVKKKFNQQMLESCKTNAGDTQLTERRIITIIKSIFDSMNLTYKCAGSQQSKDFRNINDIGLDIEVKKTDSFNIYFNDTCPSKDIYYIILFTGKKYKTKSCINPKILFINGETFIKESPWISEYHKEIEILRNKYARGDNKKKLSGCMSVYPRPTYKADIKYLLI